MNLEELMVDSKAAWMDYPGCDGFEIQVANLSRKELIAMRKKCTTSKWDRKNRIMDETLDEEKFVKLFTKATVKSWKGLKLKYLEDLILVDLKENDPESELEFSAENAILLSSNSTEFDQWINEVVFDLANFRGRTTGKTMGKARPVAQE